MKPESAKRYHPAKLELSPLELPNPLFYIVKIIGALLDSPTNGKHHRLYFSLFSSWMDQIYKAKILEYIMYTQKSYIIVRWLLILIKYCY